MQNKIKPVRHSAVSHEAGLARSAMSSGASQPMRACPRVCLCCIPSAAAERACAKVVKGMPTNTLLQKHVFGQGARADRPSVGKARAPSVLPAMTRLPLWQCMRHAWPIRLSLRRMPGRRTLPSTRRREDTKTKLSKVAMTKVATTRTQGY